MPPHQVFFNSVCFKQKITRIIHESKSVHGGGFQLVVHDSRSSRCECPLDIRSLFTQLSYAPNTLRKPSGPRSRAHRIPISALFHNHLRMNEFNPKMVSGLSLTPETFHLSLFTLKIIPLYYPAIPIFQFAHVLFRLESVPLLQIQDHEHVDTCVLPDA